MPAPLHDDEAGRLAALRDHQILDTAPTEEFDDLVRLAAQICGVPIAAVSLIDKERQWFKSIVGLPITEAPRGTSFCAHTILQSDILVVPDAQTDPRFADNPLVTGAPHIRFYAGAPLVSEEGHALGSLCIIDRNPRSLSPEQEATLRLLARQVSSHLRAVRHLAHRECLLAEKGQLAAIIENSEDAIYGKNLEGLVTSWNRGAEQLYGYSADEMIGQHVSKLVPADRHDELSSIMAAVRRGDTVPPLETVRQLRSGGRVDVSLRVSSVKDAGGRVIGAFMIARDITDRKRIEIALTNSNTRLLESEERLRRLTDAAFEGIAISHDGILSDVNPAFAEMFGCEKPEEMIGTGATNLCALESRALVLQKIADGDERPYEAVLQRRDGTTFQAELRARQTHLNGRPARVTAVRDISARKAMDEERRLSLQTLRRNEARLSEAQQVAQLGNWEYEIATGRNTWSDELFRLFEMDPAEGNPTSEALIACCHPDDVPLLRKLSIQAIQDCMPYELDIRILRADGSVRWAHAIGRGERDETGKVTRLFGTLMDITDRHLADERFRVLFERSSDAHLLLGEGGIIDCNPAAIALLGHLDKSQLLSLHPASMSPEFQPDGRLSRDKKAEMDALAYEQGFHRFEWVLRKRSDEDFPVEVTLTPVTLAGRPVLLAVLHDLTERKEAEQQVKDHAVILQFQKQALESANAELAALATTDGLTSLTNHRAFQDRLAQEVGRATRYETPLSLVLLDVDHFKNYNDQFGHPAGDDVLKQVGIILRSCARSTDVVARYGGEEFVLVLPETDGDGAAVIAERVCAAIAQADWPKRAVTASIGVASLTRDMAAPSDLIDLADAAMYQSKTAGRNRVTRDGTNTAVPMGIVPPSPQWSGYASGEGTSVAVLVSDLNGTFVSVSPRACELLGYSEAKLVGTNGLTLIHPDDIEREGWRMDDVAAGQVVVTERRVRRRDGTWLRAELRTQRIADGRAECVLREVEADRELSDGLVGNSLLRDVGDGFSMLDALLAAVDNKDRYTRQHSESVMTYALLLARELGLDQAAQDTLAAASLVHDVGKIGVPDHVLRKAGPLTDAETEAVALHPQLGAAIVSAVPGLEGTVAAVRHHHERWDGGGYPDRLHGEEIPLLARLMAVADAFSAMTTDRPYRKGMDREKALSILASGAGTQWDPECVAAFLRTPSRCVSSVFRD